MPAFTELDWARDWQDSGHAIFVATLSDGSVVYQDGDLSKSWADLKAHLADSHLAIRTVRLKFRSEWLCVLSEGSCAYYLSKGVGGIVGGPSLSLICLGYATGTGKVFRVAQVAVPVLEVISFAEREIAEDDSRVIWNAAC